MLVSLSACPQVEGVDIRITFQRQEPVYVKALSSAALTKKLGKTDPVKAGHKRRTLGLTTGNIDYAYETRFLAQSEQKSGAACFIVKELEMTVTYKPTVYVATEAKGNACRNSVLAHETRHMNTDLRMIREFLPVIRKKLKAAVAVVGARGPLPKRMLAAEQKRALKDIMDKFDPTLAKFQKDRIAAQAVHDTPENTKRDMIPCRNSRR